MKKSTMMKAAVLGAMAAATVGLAITGTAHAEEKKVQCYGVNSCKGKGECGGKDHSCAGHNSCKGKGWISLTDKDCKAQKGSTQAPEEKK